MKEISPKVYEENNYKNVYMYKDNLRRNGNEN